MCVYVCELHSAAVARRARVGCVGLSVDLCDGRTVMSEHELVGRALLFLLVVKRLQFDFNDGWLAGWLDLFRAH